MITFVSTRHILLHFHDYEFTSSFKIFIRIEQCICAPTQIFKCFKWSAELMWNLQQKNVNCWEKQSRWLLVNMFLRFQEEREVTADSAILGTPFIPFTSKWITTVNKFKRFEQLLSSWIWMKNSSSNFSWKFWNE